MFMDMSWGFYGCIFVVGFQGNEFNVYGLPIIGIIPHGVVGVGGMLFGEKFMVIESSLGKDWICVCKIGDFGKCYCGCFAYGWD
jgi:hypothetical protein